MAPNTYTYGMLMHTIKHILSLSLVAVILFSGFPVFSPEDTNRDNRVDLADVILNVKVLVQTAEQQGSFTQGVENAILSLQVLAGLNIFIKSKKNTKHNINTLTPDYTCLISSKIIPPKSLSGWQLSDRPLIFESTLHLPDKPPPESGYFS